MMRRKNISNPRQQPANRRYRRERDRYFEDELRDVDEGIDYNPHARYERPDTFLSHDYYDDNYRFTPYDRQRTYSDYPPGVDYGYEQDEYYPMDPAHHSYRRSTVTGYGNDRSLQARDFDDWRATSRRHANWRPGDFSRHRFPRQGSPDHRYDKGPAVRRASGYGEMDDPGLSARHLHGRTNRHPEIVTPFKEDRYYSRNDYNYSEGFGDNEFVFHGDRRRPFEEGGDLSD